METLLRLAKDPKVAKAKPGPSDLRCLREKAVEMHATYRGRRSGIRAVDGIRPKILSRFHRRATRIENQQLSA